MKKKSRYRLLSLVALICGILALVFYLTRGRTQFDPNYSRYAIIGFCVGIAACLLYIWKAYRELFFVAYLFFFMGVLGYLTSQMNLMGNLIYNVDGSSVPDQLIVITVAGTAAAILTLIAGISDKEKDHKKRGRKEKMKEEQA